MLKTGKCQLRKTHIPLYIETELHHILPKAMGGADVDDNKIEVCAQCHDNVHALMWRIANNKPVPAGFRAEKALAIRALNEWNGTGVVPRGDVHSNVFGGVDSWNDVVPVVSGPIRNPIVQEREKR